MFSHEFQNRLGNRARYRDSMNSVSARWCCRIGRKQNTPKWSVDIDRDTCVFSKQILLKGIYNILKLSSLFILFIHYKQQYDTKNDIVFVLTVLEIVGC